MKFNSPTRPARRARAGFTLAEVLAALLFMAIVIPVTIEAVHVASRAGVVGVRKSVATRIAENVLNDQVARSQAGAASQNGTVEEQGVQYQWSALSEQWSVDQLTLLTVQVSYPAQGQDYDVRLSTLIDPNGTNTSSTSTSTTTQ
jgi:type II secretory pathway pseudopilin PulG